ncbi:MAG TPA: malto-oligosyltrehalose trehalohydrolase, partial [Thermodesulfobacteriota bacterium]|nr:malto-oligosyltrehalose trehalohydrolase [Thermodesulfobacteriota bacterium]
ETVPMEPEGRGYFSVLAGGFKPGSRYFYLLNGEVVRPDPASRSQPQGVNGPSEIINPRAFTWQDQSWKGLPQEALIIYEIHIGTFTPSGTFEGVIPLLDILKGELGITALELMPVAQFSGNRNWGYDGTYLYAPQNSYGGPRGLKTLINACHQRGLAVILDVVYNHLGPEGNYLGEYGPYFTDRYKTPWGPAINFDGPQSDEIRRFFIDNALYWITEYHLDGLRLDAVHGIFDFGSCHILGELRQAVRRQAEKLGRTVVIFAECNLNNPRILDPPEIGGYGLDAQWNDDFHHSLHTLLTKEDRGYYQDFGKMDQLAKALQDGYVYSGQYSNFRQKRHGSSSCHLPSSKFVVFSQNHDQVGNRIKGERLSVLTSYEGLKLAAGIVLLSPGIPLLFMGEEYGEKAPFYYFISHEDESLVEAVRRSRREEFLNNAFVGEEPPDPQSQSTFLQCKLNWGLLREETHAALRNYYRYLIGLRKEFPAPAPPGKADLEISLSPDHSWMAMQRHLPIKDYLCLFNFSKTPSAIPLLIDTGDWLRVLDSSSLTWRGPGSLSAKIFRGASAPVCCHVNAQSLVVYKKG